MLDVLSKSDICKGCIGVIYLISRLVGGDVKEHLIHGFLLL
jgi:hypothetical protein